MACIRVSVSCVSRVRVCDRAQGALVEYTGTAWCQYSWVVSAVSNVLVYMDDGELIQEVFDSLDDALCQNRKIDK